jgi:hypothetical protein
LEPRSLSPVFGGHYAIVWAIQQRGRREDMTRRTIQWFRWLPFIALTGLGLWVAAGLPHGRKPFEMDLSLSGAAILLSLGKWTHYKSIALHFALAVVGAGTQRVRLAFVLTLLAGVGWELAETTAIRHHARLADLAPDLAAALACVAILMVLRAGTTRWQSWRASRNANPQMAGSIRAAERGDEADEA